MAPKSKESKHSKTSKPVSVEAAKRSAKIKKIKKHIYINDKKVHNSLSDPINTIELKKKLKVVAKLREAAATTKKPLVESSSDTATINTVTTDDNDKRVALRKLRKEKRQHARGKTIVHNDNDSITPTPDTSTIDTPADTSTDTTKDSNNNRSKYLKHQDKIENKRAIYNQHEMNRKLKDERRIVLDHHATISRQHIHEYYLAGKTLIVGDGDLSFTASLYAKRKDIHNILSTTFDTLPILKTKYPTTFPQYLNTIHSRHGIVMTGIDATKLSHFFPNKYTLDRSLGKPFQSTSPTYLDYTTNEIHLMYPFDRIIFNFPHSGQQRVHINRILLKEFFASSRPHLSMPPPLTHNPKRTAELLSDVQGKLLPLIESLRLYQDNRLSILRQTYKPDVAHKIDDINELLRQNNSNLSASKKLVAQTRKEIQGNVAQIDNKNDDDTTTTPNENSNTTNVSSTSIKSNSIDYGKYIDGFGRIMVVMRDGDPYNGWEIEDQATASLYQLESKLPWNPDVWTHYKHQTTDTQHKDLSGGSSHLYIFRLTSVGVAMALREKMQLLAAIRSTPPIDLFQNLGVSHDNKQHHNRINFRNPSSIPRHDGITIPGIYLTPDNILLGAVMKNMIVKQRQKQHAALLKANKQADIITSDRNDNNVSKKRQIDHTLPVPEASSSLAQTDNINETTEAIKDRFTMLMGNLSSSNESDIAPTATISKNKKSKKQKGTKESNPANMMVPSSDDTLVQLSDAIKSSSLHKGISSSQATSTSYIQDIIGSTIAQSFDFTSMADDVEISSVIPSSENKPTKNTAPSTSSETKPTKNTAPQKTKNDKSATKTPQHNNVNSDNKKTVSALQDDDNDYDSDYDDKINDNDLDFDDSIITDGQWDGGAVDTFFRESHFNDSSKQLSDLIDVSKSDDVTLAQELFDIMNQQLGSSKTTKASTSNKKQVKRPQTKRIKKK